MAADIRAAVIENIAQIEKSISAKSMEMAHLKEELSIYENILALLTKKQRAQNGSGPARMNIEGLLRSMPENFTSKDFVAAAASSGISSFYLRQMLTRWTKQGKLKRVRRGKYHKTKKATADRLVA